MMNDTENIVVFGKLKLTKKLLMKLPEGWWVVSDKIIEGLTPMFAEKASPESGRAEQWKRIRKAGVQQKACRLFKTTDDYNSFIESFK
jgi:hypothetical protein